MVVMEEAVEEVAAPEEVNLVELMNARARSYGMLARLFREEVDLPTLRENELVRGNWNEAEDHIALELEFMQRLSLRAADALSDDAEEEAIAYLRTSYDFLENHLLNWVPMLVADMRMHARTLFYQGLAQLTLGSLQEDEAVLRELLDSVEA